MATQLEITEVRVNTNTTDTEPFTDLYVGELVDSLGVDGASATIWRNLAASYSTKVDVTEAGATHKFSDLFKNALLMATKFETTPVSSASGPAPRVNTIVRST